MFKQKKNGLILLVYDIQEGDLWVLKKSKRLGEAIITFCKPSYQSTWGPITQQKKLRIPLMLPSQQRFQEGLLWRLFKFIQGTSDCV